MRRFVVAVLGSALIVATATPSWADAAQFRLPNAPYNGYGQNPGQIGTPRGAGVQRFNGPGGGAFRGNPGGQRFGGDPGRGRGFGGQDGYRHRGYGGAIGAGVAGLAAGALLGGALANRGYDNGYGYDQGYGYAAPVYGAPTYADPGAYEDAEAAPANGDTAAYCAERYRSYDPDSQTYLGFDGDRHPCPED